MKLQRFGSSRVKERQRLVLDDVDPLMSWSCELVTVRGTARALTTGHSHMSRLIRITMLVRRNRLPGVKRRTVSLRAVFLVEKVTVAQCFKLRQKGCQLWLDDDTANDVPALVKNHESMSTDIWKSIIPQPSSCLSYRRACSLKQNRWHLAVTYSSYFGGTLASGIVTTSGCWSVEANTASCDARGQLPFLRSPSSFQHPRCS